MLSGRGTILIFINDMIFQVMKGMFVYGAAFILLQYLSLFQMKREMEVPVHSCICCYSRISLVYCGGIWVFILWVSTLSLPIMCCHWIYTTVLCPWVHVGLIIAIYKSMHTYATFLSFCEQSFFLGGENQLLLSLFSPMDSNLL